MKVKPRKKMPLYQRIAMQRAKKAKGQVFTQRELRAGISLYSPSGSTDELPLGMKGQKCH